MKQFNAHFSSSVFKPISEIHRNKNKIIFKWWPSPAAFSFIFASFQTNDTSFKTNLSSAGIRTHVYLNMRHLPQPLGWLGFPPNNKMTFTTSNINIKVVLAVANTQVQASWRGTPCGQNNKVILTVRAFPGLLTSFNWNLISIISSFSNYKPRSLVLSIPLIMGPWSSLVDVDEQQLTLTPFVQPCVI